MVMSLLRGKFLGKPETRVLVLGLDESGKSTIVYRLKHGKVDETEIIHTIGFNVECVEYKKMIFSLWDLGGAKETRSFWRFYYEGSQAIIFDRQLEPGAVRRGARGPALAAHRVRAGRAAARAREQGRQGGRREHARGHRAAPALLALQPQLVHHRHARDAPRHAGVEPARGPRLAVDTLSTPAAQRQERARQEHADRAKAAGKAGGAPRCRRSRLDRRPGPSRGACVDRLL